MIVEKEMFLGVDGKQAAMEMIECQMAVSSIEVMQQLERNVDWFSTSAPYLVRPTRDAKFCDELYVCLFCLSAHISQKLHLRT